MYNRLARIRITVKRVSSSESDGAGGKRNVYESFDIAAEIVSQRGSRNTDFEQSSVENTKRFKIRYLPPINASDTILFEGKEYVISSIENVSNMNQFIILTCSAK